MIYEHLLLVLRVSFLQTSTVTWTSLEGRGFLERCLNFHGIRTPRKNIRRGNGSVPDLGGKRRCRWGSGNLMYVSTFVMVGRGCSHNDNSRHATRDMTHTWKKSKRLSKGRIEDSWRNAKEYSRVQFTLSPYRHDTSCKVHSFSNWRFTSVHDIAWVTVMCWNASALAIKALHKYWAHPA